MTLTRARLAADAGTQLLMAIPEGWAVKLYNLRNDMHYWAELNRDQPKLELRAWEEDLACEQDRYIAMEDSPWGSICPVANLEREEYPRIELTIEHLKD